MKRILFFCITLILVGCFSENGVELGTPSSFVKFFNDGYENLAVDLEVTADNGFLITMNSSIRDSEAEDPEDKICIIRTDQYGTELWRGYFPSLTGNTKTGIRYKAESLTSIFDNSGTLSGYLVAGQSIKRIGADEFTDLLIMILPIKTGSSTGEIDEANVLTKVWSTNYTTTNYSTNGKAAIVKPSDGNILFLAESDDPNARMIAGELDRTTLDSVHFFFYGKDYISVLTNQLFFNVNNDNSVTWAGTVNKTAAEKSDIRLPRIPIDNSTPGSDITIGGLSTAETANDICLTGSVFATIGTIDDPAQGDNTNIFFTKGSNQSVTYKSEYIPGNPANFTSEKNEIGNSISPTKDGGYIILATIDTYTGIIGRGNQDLLIMKVNGFGIYQWSVPYGTIDADEGKVIKQTSDGGYIALGTSRLAGTRSLVLIKTDKNGEVD